MTTTTCECLLRHEHGNPSEACQCTKRHEHEGLPQRWRPVITSREQAMLAEALAQFECPGCGRSTPNEDCELCAGEPELEVLVCTACGELGDMGDPVVVEFHAGELEPAPARKLDRDVHWRIFGTLRQVHLPASGLTLMASNRRDGYGPLRWLVADDTLGTVAKGEVWQGTEYQALVRQAMLEAERAAARLDRLGYGGAK